MNIDKTKDSINLEPDAHNITLKWGRQATPSDNGEKDRITEKSVFYEWVKVS